MHIYIHIPFCAKKCPYCAFGSSDKEFDLVDEYFNALSFEIKNRPLSKISTIFVGGGTPSVIKSSYYAKIFKLFEKFLDDDSEITFEANPNSANLKWLKDLKDIGVNRISFGTQSFNEKKLIFLGRNHTKFDTIKAVENAKLAGFKNINVDLIYATKFDTKKLLEDEILNLKQLELSHISAYSLILEKNTKFEDKKSYQKDSVNLAKFLFKKLEEIGFNQYEISNFAKVNPSRVCKHNLAYWQGKNYIGFGAYSVGFKDNKRFYALKDTKSYIKNPNFRDVESLNNNDLKLERLFLGFRSIVGVNGNLLNKTELKKAQILVDENKLFLKNEIFYNKNFLLADEIALFINDNFTLN